MTGVSLLSLTARDIPKPTMIVVKGIHISKIKPILFRLYTDNFLYRTALKFEQKLVSRLLKSYLMLKLVEISL